MNKTITNIVKWSIYSLLFFLIIFIFIEFSLRAIGISIILGFFAGLLNNILEVITNKLCITK